MKRAGFELVVGLFVLLGLCCVGYMTVKLGKLEVFGTSKYYALQASFRNVAGLAEGARVEIAGVQVGSVTSIRLDPGTQEAIIKLKIEKAFEIDDEAIASVKTAGLIGDRYIKIKLGSGDALEPDDFIEETESAVDLEELISKYVFGGV